MLGFFGMFGRSREIQRLDEAFREVGLPKRAVPDAIKLTMLRLLKEAGGGASPDASAAAEAARIVGYCLMGRTPFAEANGAEETEHVERRMNAALEAGDSLDACLVLLTIHARAIQPSVVERYGLEAGDSQT